MPKSFTTTRMLHFGDCDISGTAYFPSYLNILNGVNEEFWDHLGFPWHKIIWEDRWGTPTVHIRSDFSSPSFFGEELTFVVKVLKVGKSSLTIHHLDGPQKQQLFRDVHRMLAPGGVFIIADIVQPVGAESIKAAAAGWDESVRERALKLDGDTAVYEKFRQTEWNIFIYPDPMDKPSPLLDQLIWLAEAGFTEVDVYWMQAGHAIYGGKVGKP